MDNKQDKELVPGPGIVIVVPDEGEKQVGAVVIASRPAATDDVATGRVVSIGQSRGDDPDIREMGLEDGMTLHYTKNGARRLRDDLVAVDQGCVLAWE